MTAVRAITAKTAVCTYSSIVRVNQVSERVEAAGKAVRWWNNPGRRLTTVQLLCPVFETRRGEGCYDDFPWSSTLTDTPPSCRHDSPPASRVRESCLLSLSSPVHPAAAVALKPVVAQLLQFDYRCSALQCCAGRYTDIAASTGVASPLGTYLSCLDYTAAVPRRKVNKGVVMFGRNSDNSSSPPQVGWR